MENNKYNIQIGNVIKIISEYPVKEVNENGIRLISLFSWKEINGILDNGTGKLIKKHKFTKQDWKEGKCALKWEDENKEKIESFIKGKDSNRTIPSGESKYYYIYHNTWYGTNNTPLPVVTINELLEEEFVLPEKWYIDLKKLSSEQRRAVGNFFNESTKQDTTVYLSDSWKTLRSHNCGSENILKEGKKSLSFADNDVTGYKEITFEQFEKHILNKTMKTKKIIGWNLKKDCEQYADAAQKIMAVTWGTPKYHITVDYCIEALKKAGVLELWFEPLYEEEQYKVGEWVTYYSEMNRKNITDKIKRWTCNSFCILDGGTEPFKHLLRKATEAEIKEAENALLLEEAKRRYPVGTKIKSFRHGEGVVNHSKEPFIQDGEVWIYCNIRGNNLVCYSNETWAEIITAPKITINGYEAKFSEDSVSFGCQTFSKDLIEQIKKIQDLGVDITKEKDNIKEIVKYFKG